MKYLTTKLSKLYNYLISVAMLIIVIHEKLIVKGCY